MVEVTEGMELLTPPTPEEEHLQRQLSPLLPLPHGDAGTAKFAATRMRRGQMRIERHALRTAASATKRSARSGRHARRRSHSASTAWKSIAPRGPIHGIAMDLGTTTIVLRLLNLETGELIADASFENPQRFGGSDVMSRIHYDTQHPGKLLMRTLAGYLTHAIEEFPVDPKTIYEMVVVGNSTMRDIFFRQNVYSIGQNPYRSITEIEMAEGKRTTTSVTQTGRRACCRFIRRPASTAAPIISGHVGADAAACMLAVDMANEDRLVAVMDIGTNTELILGNKHRILAASCPAGPAFEGGAIACGMPGTGRRD